LELPPTLMATGPKELNPAQRASHHRTVARPRRLTPERHVLGGAMTKRPPPRVATEQRHAAAAQADLLQELLLLRRALRAEEREADFWIDEAERFRNQLVEVLRERAMEKS